MGHILVEHVSEAKLTQDLTPNEQKEHLDQAGKLTSF